MSCHACGARATGGSDRCPACGAALAGNGCTDRGRGRLIPDGGQPTDDDGDDTATEGESTGGQSTGGQSPGGQDTGGQSTGGQAAGGQSGGGQAAGGQSTGDQSGGRQPDGGQSHPSDAINDRPERSGGSDVDLGAIVESLPLKGGVAIGLLASLLPYIIITLVSYVPLERDEFGIGAELYATVVGFGPGRRFVNLFVGGTDISALENVRPSDYPSFQGELSEILFALQFRPESLLLLLYVMVPLVCYLGGRYLAGKHADADEPLEHATVGVPMVLGALIVTVPVTLAFGVQALAGAIFVGGLFVPLLFGALGGLTVYAFSDVGWGTGKMYGWLSAILGILGAIVFFPLILGGIPLDLGQRFLFGIMGFLLTVRGGFPMGGPGLLTGLFVAGAVVLAGFVRVHRSSRSPGTVAAGAHMGASVVLGFVAAVAVLGIAQPILGIMISVPGGAMIGTVMANVSGFTATVIGAAIFALLFGAGGGGLAVWYRDRENTELT